MQQTVAFEANQLCPSRPWLGLVRVGGRVTRIGGLSSRRMASIELDGRDAPACPLLGLAADPRSHFTYPHPGHRCYATKSAASADASRQATFCLGPGYTACDRYRARLRSVGSDRPPATKPTAGR